MRPPHDPAIELDHHGARIETEMLKEIRRGGGTREPPRLTVHHDLEIAHVVSAQGASMARVAAAGSAACHSARMAATP